MKYGSSELYEQLVEITADYLGPASRRFIDRQIVNHLEKDPIDISPDDLDSLIDWIGVSTAMLTDDKGVISEFRERLQELNSNQRDRYV